VQVTPSIATSVRQRFNPSIAHPHNRMYTCVFALARSSDKLMFTYPEPVLDDEDQPRPEAEWPTYLDDDKEMKPAEAVELAKRFLAHAARLGFEKQGPATRRCRHCDFEVTASWNVSSDEWLQHVRSKHPQTPETDMPPAQPPPAPPPAQLPSAPPPAPPAQPETVVPQPVAPQRIVCEWCGQGYLPEHYQRHIDASHLNLSREQS
jgi:hypothetical protein